MSESLRPLNGHEERLIRAAGDSNFITVQRLILTLDQDRMNYEKARDAYLDTINAQQREIRRLRDVLRWVLKTSAADEIKEHIEEELARE
jgi:hypothetical protein